MAWYLAPSLAVLRAEINAAWPGRDKASDGTIGDAAHSATTSDHNPNSRGSVNAIDIDEDGIDVAAVLAAIKKHPSARYLIYERRLYHRDRGWRAEAYSGSNPHTAHFHLSIDQTRTAEQDTRPWGISSTEGGDHVIGLKKGDKGDQVKGLQGTLRYAGFDPGEVDGVYGSATSAAVLKMRKSEGSTATDGDNFTGWAYAQLHRALAKKYGGGGTVSAAQIAAEVAKYLQAHPPKDGKTPTRVRLNVEADVVATE